MFRFIRRATRDGYKKFVGSIEMYDSIGRSQFDLLLSLGLRPNHYLLDIGCGCLRGGRFYIPYLDPGHYFGESVRVYLGRADLRITRRAVDCG